MTTRVREYVRGESTGGLRDKLNEVANANNATLTQGVGNRGAAYGEAYSGRTIWVEVKSLDFADFPRMTCVYPGQSGDPSATEFTVNVPPTFSEASRGSRTYTYSTFNQRTATDAPDTETQYLQPDYQVGDPILISMAPYYAGNAVTWEWRDLNVDGRQWVADPT